MEASTAHGVMQAAMSTEWRGGKERTAGQLENHASRKVCVNWGCTKETPGIPLRANTATALRQMPAQEKKKKQVHDENQNKKSHTMRTRVYFLTMACSKLCLCHSAAQSINTPNGVQFHGVRISTMRASPFSSRRRQLQSSHRILRVCAHSSAAEKFRGEVHLMTPPGKRKSLLTRSPRCGNRDFRRRGILVPAVAAFGRIPDTVRDSRLDVGIEIFDR